MFVLRPFFFFFRPSFPTTFIYSFLASFPTKKLNNDLGPNFRYMSKRNRKQMRNIVTPGLYQYETRKRGNWSFRTLFSGDREIKHYPFFFFFFFFFFSRLQALSLSLSLSLSTFIPAVSQVIQSQPVSTLRFEKLKSKY